MINPRNPDLHRTRGEYLSGKLTRDSVSGNPFDQFRTWISDAVETKMRDANAVSLSTADASGRPSSRMVLLKSFDEDGFVITTNYESRKGRELALNPHGFLLFFWPALERQVRIEGPVERTSVEESDRIFEGRPRGARLSAWASRQSSIIEGRAALETRLRDLDKRYPAEIPRPEYWGGFRLYPEAFEFWQGRMHRLHDRLRFTRGGEGGWTIERLSP